MSSILSSLSLSPPPLSSLPSSLLSSLVSFSWISCTRNLPNIPKLLDIFYFISYNFRAAAAAAAAAAVVAATAAIVIVVSSEVIAYKRNKSSNLGMLGRKPFE